MNIAQDKTIWLALMASLLAHSVIFIFSAKSLAELPHYSVQPQAAQTVEVSIEPIHNDQTVLETTGTFVLSKKVHKQTVVKPKAGPMISKSGVMVKANPDYIQNPPPEYPELAKQMRQEGLVMLAVDVDAQGDPLNVEVIQSCGHRMLDEAALKAVAKWKFQPGRIGSLPVESKVTVPVRFRLQ